MEYFVQPVHWEQRSLFLIYFSNDEDGVLLNSDNKIAWAAEQAGAEVLAKKRRLKLKAPRELLELSTIQSWVNSRSPRLPASALLYRAWGFFGDVATSLTVADQYLGYDEEFIPLHDELFWGCNMPGLTQSQELYQVELSQAEIKNLKRVMRSGLEIFRQGIA